MSISNGCYVYKDCDTCDYEDCRVNKQKKEIERIKKQLENAVVINKDENPCLSCPVPEDIQRDVDCSTICGSVRLGIDWQNQCKVLVKENKQLKKELAQVRKEMAEKFAERLKESLKVYLNEDLDFLMKWCECNITIDEICKEFTEGEI